MSPFADLGLPSGRLAAAAVFAAALASALPSLGEDVPGTLLISVQDRSHAVVPGVALVLTGPSGRLETTTDARGVADFEKLPPGSYDLTASRSGFEPRPTPGIVVHAGERHSIEIILEVKGLSEELSVHGSGAYAAPKAVSGTKTDTPIFETPVSVQVVPQAVLQDQQATRLQQATDNVSGVYRTADSRTDQYSVRGFETYNFYRDGVPVNTGDFGSTPNREMANVERVEVLKGPPAILFGADQPGGLVNVITKQPVATRLLAVGQQLGSQGFARTTLDAGGPLSESARVQYRFNGAFERGGGVKEFAEDSRVFLAPVVSWNMGPHTRLAFEGEFLHARSRSDQEVVLVGGAPADVPFARDLTEDAGGFEWNEFRFGFDWNQDLGGGWRLRQHLSADTFDDNLEPTVFVDGVTDPDQCGLSGCLVGRSVQDFAGGFQQQHYYYTAMATGALTLGRSRHTLLIGGEYQRRRQSASPGFRFTDYTPIDLYAPVHTGLPDDALSEIEPEFGGGPYTGYTAAGFVQDQVTLPGGVHVLAGLRYDKTRGLYDSDPADAATPRLGVLWNLIRPLTAYATYTRSFSGGNGRTADGSLLPPVRGRQYEIGVKAQTPDERLRATAAWYDLARQNTTVPDPDPTLARLGFVRALGEVLHRGFEVDVAGRLGAGLSVVASYSFIDSEITRDGSVDEETGDVTPGNTGNRMFGVPRHGGSLWASWRRGVGTGSEIVLGGGVVGRGSSAATNENTLEVDGYLTASAMLGYTRPLGRGALDLQLNLDNLFDERVLLPLPYGGSTSTLGFGDTRRVRVQVTLRR